MKADVLARVDMKTIEEMRRELIAAGWKKWNGNSHIWKSPIGGIWRGPALAWHVMNNLPWPPVQAF